MYFMDAVRLMTRRWYVAAIGLVLVAGGVAYTMKTLPTQYQASGEMLFLLPPDSTGHATPSNPYINLVPGLTTTASLIATEAMTKDVTAQLAQEGFVSEYSVALVPSTGPLLTISTKDTDPARAVAMRDRVMKWLRDRLDQRQRAVSVPASQSIYTEDTNVGKGAEIVPGNKIRALAGVGAAGGIVTLVAAFVVDKILSRRRTVRELKLAKVEEDEDDEEKEKRGFEADKRVKVRRGS
jgi:capsular polysaccharide biosynthesis protein